MLHRGRANVSPASLVVIAIKRTRVYCKWLHDGREGRMLRWIRVRALESSDGGAPAVGAYVEIFPAPSRTPHPSGKPNVSSERPTRCAALG